MLFAKPPLFCPLLPESCSGEDPLFSRCFKHFQVSSQNDLCVDWPKFKSQLCHPWLFLFLSPLPSISCSVTALSFAVIHLEQRLSVTMGFHRTSILPLGYVYITASDLFCKNLLLNLCLILSEKNSFLSFSHYLLCQSFTFYISLSQVNFQITDSDYFA